MRSNNTNPSAHDKGSCLPTPDQLAEATGGRITKINGEAASVAPDGSAAPEVQPAPNRGSDEHSASEEAPLDFDSMYGPVGSERNVEETTFQIAVGKTVKTATGNQSITLTTLAEKIRKLGAVANKADGYILHFAQFPQGVRRRTYANIEACTAAPFDFDGRNGDKVKREDFEEVCREAGVEVITWLTHSAPDDPTGCTFRAAMPYKEPLAVDLHMPAMAAIGKMLGMTPDKPLPATQGFFCQPRPGVEHDVRVLQGKPIDTLIDLHGLEPVTEAPPDHQERATGASNSAGKVLSDQQVADAIVVIDALREQGLHKDDEKGVWHRVIGALAAYGEQGKELALRFSEDGCKTWKADTIKKIGQKLKNGATGIGNLFAIAAEFGIENPGKGKRPAAEDEFADDLAGVFDEVPAPNLTPDVRKHMNACIDMALTLRDGGFRDLHGPVRAMQNDAGKVIRQNEDGTWQAEGGQAKDAADLLVSSIYKGDAAAAESEWLVWAEDGEQMNWFSGHAGRSGAYSARALVAFMRNKVGNPIPDEVPESVKPVASIAWPPGLVGEVATYILNSSRMPVPAFAIAGALSVISYLIRNFGHVVTSDTALNLYLVLVGGTGKGKEDPRKAIKRILDAMGDRDITAQVVENMSSGTALLRSISHPNLPYLLMMSDEYGIFMQAAMQGKDEHRRDLVKELMSLYGLARSFHAGKKYANPKENIQRIDNPYIVTLGTTTEEELFAGLNMTAINNGSANRNIYIYADADVRPNRRPDIEVPKVLIDKLQALFGTFALTSLHALQYAPAAEEALIAFGDNLPTTGKFVNLWSRAEESVIRVAGVLAFCDGKIIKLEHVRWAIEYVKATIEHFDIRSETQISEGLFDKKMNKVLEVISNARHYSNDAQFGSFTRKGKMPRGKLLKLMKIPAKELEAVIEVLVASKQINRATEGETTIYWA